MQSRKGLPAILSIAITVAFDNPYLGLACCAKLQIVQSM
jgi:hypothetical protein